MNQINPEILAPGGDFNSSVHALKNGADAVYVGMTSFSARRKAKNFTIDEVRRLKTYCDSNDKKIYIAINTLLKDSELNEIYPLLKELEEIQVDAIIVQDLGLIKLIKDNSKLIIHASTQLAVHNIHGVKILKELGVTRAVLSRELSLNEIQMIKDEYPEIELEIFIHGALCYGFSGLCLASSKIIGRSANRGECGQICRTWFNNEGNKEYCFSLNDLSLKEKVLKLKDIGIESLKIEGRMKGPSYASATSKLYFNILNNIDYKEEQVRAATEFNRSGHDAYIINKEYKNSVNTNYPGHTGIEIGNILSIQKSSFTVELSGELENRDGILIFEKTSPYTPLKLATSIISKDGSRVILKGNLPKNISKKLYKISNHNKHLKEEKLQSYKPFKSEVPINIELTNNSIIITTQNNNYNYDFKLEEANSTIDLNKIFNKVFLAGGTTNYKFPTTIKNSSSYSNPFIIGSKLKEIRNSFQEKFVAQNQFTELILIKETELQERSYIKNSSALPFIVSFKNITLSQLSKENESYLLPIAPVIFDSKKYLNELTQFLKQNEEAQFIIGLNNISHISFIEKLPLGIEYYCDYGLYALNNYSKKLLLGLIPNLKWTTKWIEEDNIKSYPPIFISRTCFKAQKDGCPKGCKKTFEYKVSQNGNYKIVIEDCISYTFTESGSNS